MARLCTWKNDSKSFKADRSKSMVSIRFIFVFILFYLALRSRETFLLLMRNFYFWSYSQIHTHNKHINERVWLREISQLLHRHNEHTLNVCITRRNLFYFTHFNIVRWNPFTNSAMCLVISATINSLFIYLRDRVWMYENLLWFETTTTITMLMMVKWDENCTCDEITVSMRDFNGWIIAKTALNYWDLHKF